MSIDYDLATLQRRLLEAVPAAVEGTGLVASFGGGLAPLGGLWLQTAGSDSEAGYWVYCKGNLDRTVPVGTFLRVTYLFPAASWADCRDGLSDIEEVLSLALVGPQAGDGRILAALVAAAVRDHMHNLAGRAA